MKRIMRLAVPMAAALLLFVPQTALAASTISSVSLTIDSNISVGDSDSDVEVSTNSSKYDVEEVEVTNEPSDEWEEDDKPKLKITLEANDDYTFKSGFSKSNVDLDGDDGTVTSVSRSSDTLKVYVTLDALDEDDEDDYELDVYELEWDENSGYAYWEGEDDAKKYEVRLYRGSTAVTSILTTTSEQYNFAPYFTGSGSYTFKVRGVYSSSHKGDWEESDSWYVSASEASAIYAAGGSVSTGGSTSGSSAGPAGGSYGGAWLLDSVGWWYCNADKTYTVNNWQYIDNKWYYFDEVGYMKTGWILWNSKWYYCGSDGAMLANTTTPDGYYVGSDGAWIQ